MLARGFFAVVCAAIAFPVAAADEADEAQLKSLRDQIIRLIGSAPCVNLVHCRAIALGTRPCGGPAEYLAYSNMAGQNNSKEAIETKAYEYTFLYEDLQRGKKSSGTCEVLRPPRPACVDGRCRIDTGPQ